MPVTSEVKSELPWPPADRQLRQAQVGGLHDGAGQRVTLGGLHVDQQLAALRSGQRGGGRAVAAVRPPTASTTA